MSQRLPSTSGTRDARLWAYDPISETWERVTLEDGQLKVVATVSVSGADGAIVDGVTPTIKATVRDYTASKPITVALTDANGDHYDAGATVGGATAAKQDTGNASLASIDGKVPASPATTGKQDTGNTSLAAIDTNAGATADAKVTGDNTGTVSAKLRGLSYLIALCTDTVNSWIKVSIQNTTLAVTKSGTWLVDLISGQTGITGGAGAVAANTPRMTLASDDPAVATLGATTGTKVVTDANGTIQQYLRGLVTFLANALGAGTAAAANRVTLASDDPAVATLGATSGAKVITDANGTIQQYLRGLIYQMITAGASFMTPVPDTVNGWLVTMMTSADGSTPLTNSAQAIKASAGKLGGWFIYNPNTSAVFIPIYNVAAGSVTVGTTNPYMTLCIPPLSAANEEFAMGIPFSNAGWSAAATTTGPGNGAPTTALEVNFLYK